MGRVGVRLLHGSSWDHPVVRLACDARDAFEACVVVQNGESGGLGGSRDDQVRDGQPVLTSVGEQALYLQGAVQSGVVDLGPRQGTPFATDVAMHRSRLGGVADLEIDDPTGGRQPIDHQRLEPGADLRVEHPGKGLVAVWSCLGPIWLVWARAGG